MGKDYEEQDDFSIYEEDLDTVARNRRERKKKDKKHKGNVADTYRADFDEDETITVKSTRQKRDLSKQDDLSDDTVVAPPIMHKQQQPPVQDIKKDNLQQAYTSPQQAGNMPQKGVAANAQKGADMKKQKKTKKPMSLKRKFFTILGVILGIYAIFLIAFIGITYSEKGTIELPTNPLDPVKKVTEKTAEVVVGKVPDRTVVLLMVTDEDKTRTDTIVLANFDNVNNRLTMLSIPRDTIVEVSDDMYTKMRSEFPEPGKKQMKINAIHHYGGENHGIEYLETELERMFGVKPDYYVRLDFEGFNYIIDSIGGIEFDVPMDMVYDDPAQDLHINLQKGLQVLDGDKAQQLVRFRKDNYGNGYAGGDLDRINVQQEFMKTFMKKALSSEAIFGNILSYMTAFNKYVTTDATINDMVRYTSVLKNLNMDNVVTLTLPGQPAYVSGISGYLINEDEAASMIYNVFERPLGEVADGFDFENVQSGTMPSLNIISNAPQSNDTGSGDRDYTDYDFDDEDDDSDYEIDEENADEDTGEDTDEDTDTDNTDNGNEDEYEDDDDDRDDTEVDDQNDEDDQQDEDEPYIDDEDDGEKPAYDEPEQDDSEDPGYDYYEDTVE